MIEITVATRYADALFAIAKEKDSIDQWEQELGLVNEAIESNPEFKRILNHPYVDNAAKKTLISDILKGSISDLLENFLHLLVDKKRINFFSHIVRAYILRANEARGIADATVVTPKALSADQQEHIRKTFEGVVGKKIRIATEIDPQIVGGFIVRIGDRVYDSSIKTQLNRFKATLHESRV